MSAPALPPALRWLLSAEPGPALRIQGGKLDGELVALEPGELSIGTGRTNTLRLRERGVGFKHALLRVGEEGQLELEDLGAAGGTRVNGEVLAKQGTRALRLGDAVELGTIVLAVEAAQPDGPRALSLLIETSDRAGERVPLEPGSHTIGTSRRCEVVIRERGVGFKHAELSLDDQGVGQVTDLGTRGGTQVNEEAVPARESAPVRPGDRLHLGELRLLLEAKVQEAGDVPLDGPRAQLIGGLLPEGLSELGRIDERSRPLEQVLAELEGDPRIHLDYEARGFAERTRELVSAELAVDPHPPWLRYDPELEELHARIERDGVICLMRCWELLARLPTPVREEGPEAAAPMLDRLLAADASRLIPDHYEPAGGGFWRCEFVAEQGMLGGRFDRIDALCNGRMLIASFTPRFIPNPLLGGVAEDPIREAIRSFGQRSNWRPPPNSSGPPAPNVPPGGRYGRRRHKPTRPVTRDPRQRWT